MHWSVFNHPVPNVELLTAAFYAVWVLASGATIWIFLLTFFGLDVFFYIVERFQKQSK